MSEGPRLSHRGGMAVVMIAALCGAPSARAQVDSARAAEWFREAARLCEREGGKLWGVSLCGPMAIADAATRTIAANQALPEGKWPPAVGFGNAAIDWNGTRWSIFVWQYMPMTDERMRARLMMHELFHRIQPQLGFMVADGQNGHLDTPDGRYWLQLEWRALEKALAASGARRDAAVRDALGFRSARYRRFPTAAENERPLEINEGLAQYTGTVAATSSRAEAIEDAIEQLQQAPVINQTLVRTFPYPSGAAYGLLLDGWSPGWTRRIKPSDDIAGRVAAASKLRPTEDAEAAALRYGGAELKATEAEREEARQRRIAEHRRRFVEQPVLTLPNGRNNSFVTNGITPVPGAGTVYPTFRSTGPWGSLEAALALMSADGNTLAVPAPGSTEGSILTGDGWTLRLTPGWVVRPGSRAGDYRVVRDSAAPPAVPSAQDTLTPARLRSGAVAFGTDTADVFLIKDSVERTNRPTTWTIAEVNLGGKPAIRLSVGGTAGYVTLVDRESHAPLSSRYLSGRDSFDVTFRGAAVRGWIAWNGQPWRTIADSITPIPFMGVALEHMLGALPLHDEYSAVLPVYSPYAGTGWVRVRVVGSESLPYLGRQHDCWKVELSAASGSGAPARRFWIDKSTGKLLQRENRGLDGSRVLQRTR